MSHNISSAPSQRNLNIPLSSAEKIKAIAVAIFTITLLGSLIAAGIGGTAYMGASFSHINQIHALIIMSAGGGGAFVSTIVLLVVSPRLHKLRQTRRQLSPGLTTWINEERDKSTRETRASTSFKIITCYQNNSTHLDLSGLSLSSLPSGIGNLTCLTQLNLANNNLTHLPTEIGQLANLESLTCNNNQLAYIPAEIGSLTHLKTVWLQHNQLTSLPNEVLALPATTSINVKNNPLSDDFLNHLKEVSRPNIHVTSHASRNPTREPLVDDLIEIEQVVEQPRHEEQPPPQRIVNQNTRNPRTLMAGVETWLKEAQDPLERSRRNQAYNKIKVCNKSKATKLDLSDIRLQSLPEEIGMLTQLKYLYLNNNNLTSLPSLERLTNLEYLSVAGNQLTNLSSDIGRLTHLKELQLNDNALTNLPTEIGNLSNLSHLTLTNNQLTSLPNEILNLSTRTIVHIENNPLSETVLQRLREAINVLGYSGPTISFSMERVRARYRPRKPLEDYLNELSQTTGEAPLELKNLIGDMKHKEDLWDWLWKMSDMADYKTKRKDLAKDVYRLIKKAEDDSLFRETFWVCIEDAASTCGDRMALSLLYTDVQYQIALSEQQQDWGRLAYLLGHGAWALGELRKIAADKVKTLNFFDEVEVYLAYPVKLKKALDLPIITDNMLFFHESYAKQADLDRATMTVMKVLSDKEKYLDILSEDQKWLNALKTLKTDRYNTLKDTYDDADDLIAARKEFKQGIAVLSTEVLNEYGWPTFLKQ